MTREQQLEVALKQLVSTHFFGKSLEWAHCDGVTLFEKDFELYLQIASLLPEVIKEM
jgi:hypothetical protein